MQINRHAVTVIRERSGLRRVDLAREAGISPQLMSAIELGQRGGSPEVIKRIADALAVPVTAIINKPAEVPA